MVSHQDDIRIDSVFEAAATSQPSHESFHVLRIKALTLLAECAKLRRQRPEVGQSPPRGGGLPTLSTASFVSNPHRFSQLKAALDQFVRQLPHEYRVPWEQWDEGDEVLPHGSPRVRSDGIGIHFLVGNAYLQLWNIRSLRDENSKAVLVARRMANLIPYFQPPAASSGYDVFLITVWNDVAMILLREVKRLLLMGNPFESAGIDVDLDVVTNAIRVWASRAIVGDHEGIDVAAINTKMFARLRALSLDEWVEAFEESSRRYG